MKNQIFSRSVFILISIIAFLISGCTKMDGTYKKFLEGGEYRYSKKPDSVGINPGKNRVEVWLLVSSPTISEGKVYWNNRADSVVIPFETKLKTDTIRTIIEDMEEGAYTFEFLTIDKEGNPSLPVDTTGDVYGDIYMSSLNPVIVEKASIINNEVIISWLPSSHKDALATELQYTDAEGKAQVLLVHNDSTETRIKPRPQAESIKFRSLFLPHPDAIDTFYTDFQAVTPEVVYSGFPETFEETEYSKSKYAAAEVQIGSGLWNLDNFLIGDAPGDQKNGARSARSYHGQNSSGPKNSILEMRYDLPDGASKISFYHAICANDDPSSFKVQVSKDAGETWEDISEIYTNGTTLTYREIALDIDGPVRFRFYKLSSVEAGREEGRMNIDDIDIYPNP